MVIFKDLYFADITSSPESQKFPDWKISQGKSCTATTTGGLRILKIKLSSY